MTTKNIINDGSIPMSGNFNLNGHSIINVKELLPQTTGSGGIGRFNRKWNIFANILNLTNFNIEESTLQEGSTNKYSTIIQTGTLIEGISLTYGVGNPPLNSNVAILPTQTKILMTEDSIIFMFSETTVGQKATEWNSSIKITKNGLDYLKIDDLEVEGSIFASNIKVGTTQAGAGAVAGEFWCDSSDNYTIKLGQ